MRAKELSSEKSSPDTSSRSHGKPEEEEKGGKPIYKSLLVTNKKGDLQKNKKVHPLFIRLGPKAIYQNQTY